MNDHVRPPIGQPIERPLPVSIEAEQALLGAIMLNNDAYHQAAGLVQIEHFSEEIHRRIFDVMQGLIRESRPASFANLLQFLGNHEVMEGVTTGAYLARLAAQTPAIVSAPDYARTIRDMHVRREVIAAARKLEDSAHDARVSISPDDLAADGLGILRTVLEQAPQRGSRHAFVSSFDRLIANIEKVRDGEVVELAFSTGYADIDAVTSGGYRPKTVWVVAGRPGMGKSIFMTGSALRAAKAGTGVLEFSLELPEAEITARHVADLIYDNREPVEFASIQTGQVTDHDFERIVVARRAYEALPLVVDCPDKLVSCAEIAARVHVEKKRMAARGVTLGVVFVDYVDKVRAGQSYAGQRTYEIQEVMNDLKAIARAEDVCVVVLAQLNRGLEGRDDKRPNMADLKSSGSLEQEAAICLFLHREAYFVQKSAKFRDGDAEALDRFQVVKHDVEAIVGKNRQGPETLVHLWGDVACSTFQSAGRRA